MSDATHVTFDLDTVGPTVLVTLPALDANGVSVVTITFSEVPVGFDPLVDLEVVGGTLTNLTADGTTKMYTGTFTAAPGFDGTAKVGVNASYSDEAGNAGTSGIAELSVDTLAPTVSSIILSDTTLKIGETAQVAIVFSEAVTGFTLDDITVENGSLSNFATSDGGKTWTAIFTPTANIEDLTNLIKVTAGYTDVAGNTGTASDSSNYVVDTKAPVVSSIQLSDIALKTGETAQVAIVFSEAVTGFTLDDITVENGSLSNLATSDDGKTWTAIFTPTANIQDAENRIKVGADYTDIVGNAGSGLDSDNYAINTKNPGVASIQLSDTALKTGETAVVTIVFSESVINFSNADLTAENGTVGNLTSTDGGKTWTGVFTPNQDIEDATNLIHVASTYTDPDGNDGTEATSGNYSIDTSRPSIGITGVKSSSNTLLATFTFSGAINPSTFTAHDVLAHWSHAEKLGFKWRLFLHGPPDPLAQWRRDDHGFRAGWDFRRFQRQYRHRGLQKFPGHHDKANERVGLARRDQRQKHPEGRRRRRHHPWRQGQRHHQRR